MRTKYGSFPEYHTSLDALGAVVTPEGLAGAMLAYMRAIQILELDFYPSVTNFCEPQLGRRGLYPTISIKGAYGRTRLLRELLSSGDGTSSVSDFAEREKISFLTAFSLARELLEEGLIEALFQETEPA